MMKKTVFIYISIVLTLFFFGCIVLYHQEKTDTVLKQFLKTYHIKKSDIQFRTAQLSFFGNGLIFYRVRLPELRLTHKIDKVIVQTKENLINIQLIGVEIDVIDTLRRLHGVHVLSALASYRPFEDALIKPLESLALMGIDCVKLNAVLSFEPFKKVIVISGGIAIPRLADIYFSFVLSHVLDTGYKKSLVYAFYGIVKDVFFEVRDKGGFKKYKAYLEGIGMEKADQDELMTSRSIIRRIKLEQPLSLMQNYRSVAEEKGSFIPTF